VKLYKKSNKRTINNVNEQEDNLELPRLLPFKLIKIWDIAIKVREFNNYDPTKFLNNSREVFKYIIKAVDI
jgi:hypothetical protein